MAKRSRSKFLCLDCRVDTGKLYEHYMLVESTWTKVHNSKFGMLCVGCVENRLGRKLTKVDFNSSFVNDPKLHRMSARLLERLTAVN